MLFGLCMHIIDPMLGLNFGPQIRKKGAHPNRGKKFVVLIGKLGYRFNGF